MQCPDCGSTEPTQEEIDGMARHNVGKLGSDPLDWWEVLGCDDGNVMCPSCSCEFPIEKRQKQLFSGDE